MSYYDNETICPKCGQYSKNLDACEHCGALISRIRQRDEQNTYNDLTPKLDVTRTPEPSGVSGGSSVSLTAIALVVLLLGGISAAMYYKAGGFDRSDTPSALGGGIVPANTPLSQPSAEATPIYNFSKPKPTAASTPEVSPATPPQSSEPGVFASIAEAFKAQSPQPAREPVPQQQPTAAPEKAAPSAPAAGFSPTAAISYTPSANNPLAPINLGEADISSIDFSRKASEYKPATTANAPAPSPSTSSASAAKAPALKRPVVAVNSRSFSQEVLFHRAEPVLVDFYATWCGPCKRLAPQLEVFAGLNEGIKVVKIDIDQNKDLARKYKIVSVPTLILFKDGKMLGRNSGVPSMAQLQASIKPHL